MKSGVVLVLLFLSIMSYAQESERLTFSKVIPVENADSKSIFVAVKSWFGMNFVSAKSVIEVEDKDAGLIIGNSLVPYSKGGLSYSAYEGDLKFTLKIQIKDNRFKVTVSNYLHEGTRNPNYELGVLTTSETFTNKGMNKKFHNIVWADLKAKAEQIANKYFLDLSKIEVKSSQGSEDDW